jgi:hypothetical protein
MKAAAGTMAQSATKAAENFMVKQTVERKESNERRDYCNEERRLDEL